MESENGHFQQTQVQLLLLVLGPQSESLSQGQGWRGETDLRRQDGHHTHRRPSLSADRWQQQHILRIATKEG